MEWWWEVAVKWTTATYAAPPRGKAAGGEGGKAAGGEGRFEGGTTTGVDTVGAGDTVHDDVGGSSAGDDGKDTLNDHRGNGIIPATRYTSSHIGYPSTITYWLPSEPTVFWHSEYVHHEGLDGWMNGW